MKYVTIKAVSNSGIKVGNYLQFKKDLESDNSETILKNTVVEVINVDKNMVTVESIDGESATVDIKKYVPKIFK